jgi:hypothetical protein
MIATFFVENKIQLAVLGSYMMKGKVAPFNRIDFNQDQFGWCSSHSLRVEGGRNSEP